MQINRRFSILGEKRMLSPKSVMCSRSCNYMCGEEKELLTCKARERLGCDGDGMKRKDGFDGKGERELECNSLKWR